MTIDLNLDTFALYIRREAALQWAAWGLVGGLGAAALVNLAAWLFPLLAWLPRLALSLGLPAMATLSAFLAAYLFPRQPMRIARESDARLSLLARLATALEIQEGRLAVPDDLAARQRADAVSAARQADPRQAFVLRFPRRQAWIAAILLALIVAGFAFRNPQETRMAQKQAEQEVIQKQIDRLEQVRQEIAANPNLREEDKQTLLKEIDDTIQDLQEGNLSKEQALARLSETEGRLKELLKELPDEDVQVQAAALDQAGQQALQDPATQEVGQALQQGDYPGAAQAFEELGENLDQMPAQEQTALAERLEAMADAVQSTHPELAQALRDAATALRQGDTQAAQEALQRAAELTEQAGEQLAAETAAQEATEQALGQIQEGKEQIAQSGQGEGQQGQGGGQQGQQEQGQGTGSGSGHGDSNGQQGGQGTPAVPQGQIGSNQPGDGGQKPYDPIYAPERLGEGEGGTQVTIPREGEDGPPTGEGEGGPHEEGQALVPYDQVYTDYQAQAASALENSYIPRGMKDYVRAYFSSLEPGQ